MSPEEMEREIAQLRRDLNTFKRNVGLAIICTVFGVLAWLAWTFG